MIKTSITRLTGLIVSDLRFDSENRLTISEREIITTILLRIPKKMLTKKVYFI
jgi:hypothetical protein